MNTKKMFHIWIVMIATCCSCQVFGQSSGYEDASSPLGAVGMMQMNLKANDLIKSKCKAKFPSMGAEIEDNLTKWRMTEGHDISIAERIWPDMVAQEPKFLQMLEAQNKMLNGIFDSFENMPKEVGSEMYMNACHKRFAGLADGIWRQRTPMAYKYLDEMK